MCLVLWCIMRQIVASSIDQKQNNTRDDKYCLVRILLESIMKLNDVFAAPPNYLCTRVIFAFHYSGVSGNTFQIIDILTVCSLTCSSWQRRAGIRWFFFYKTVYSWALDCVGRENDRTKHVKELGNPIFQLHENQCMEKTSKTFLSFVLFQAKYPEQVQCFLGHLFGRPNVGSLSFEEIFNLASCQIRKIAGCACARDAGIVFPTTTG